YDHHRRGVDPARHQLHLEHAYGPAGRQRREDVPQGHRPWSYLGYLLRSVDHRDGPVLVNHHLAGSSVGRIRQVLAVADLSVYRGCEHWHDHDSSYRSIRV